MLVYWALCKALHKRTVIMKQQGIAEKMCGQQFIAAVEVFQLRIFLDDDQNARENEEVVLFGIC